MKHLLVIMSLLAPGIRLKAQSIYTITADSVKLTSCDSSELIIMNHTQNVPGFLFNTGNGRTIFKRAIQSLGNNAYAFGADTLQLASPNAWTQGGNSFGATGVLGTTDDHPLNVYTNDILRATFDSLGGFNAYGTGYFGKNVSMANYTTLSVGGTYIIDDPDQRLVTCVPGETLEISSGVGGYALFNGNIVLGTGSGYGIAMNPDGTVNPAILISSTVPSPSSTVFSFGNLRNDGPKKGVINTVDFNAEAQGGTTAVDLYLYPGKETYSGSQGNTIIAYDGSAQRGNVGIGTPTPTAQLHTTGSVRLAGLTQDSTQTQVLVTDANGNVYYRSASSLAADDPVRSSLAVNGTIKSKKIIISPDEWADYVFDSTYRLPRLEDLESYIHKEHHLPGVPSAATVQKDSLDVGANQAALLKKIEELTLYSIDQEKELAEQRKAMELQKKEIGSMKARMQKLERRLEDKTQ
jgi:hypothetical protein